jgi:DNA-binding MarR family transcriptional regulator
MDELRTSNLLGAAALAISDRLIDAVAEMVNCGASAPAALITLVSEPGVGITVLGARIGLSQPAAARLVSNLEVNGLVERRAGQDSRSQALFPTDLGYEKAREALKLRQHVTGELLGELEPSEKKILTSALEKMLTRLLDENRRPYVLCRICDRAMCIADGHICPVNEAARVRGL